MGEWLPLDTAAGQVRAWCARPDKPAHGAVVVLQEIFGVNPHIRGVTDGFARDGFVAIAPALFDPVQPDVELGYGGLVPHVAAVRVSGARLYGRVDAAGLLVVHGGLWFAPEGLA